MTIFLYNFICMKGDSMYNEKIFLTPQEILDKEFKIDARGYRPQEVDKFLDLVIRDYTEFLTTIKKLDKDIHDLTEDNVKFKQEMRKLRGKSMLTLSGMKVVFAYWEKITNSSFTNGFEITC